MDKRFFILIISFIFCATSLYLAISKHFITSALIEDTTLPTTSESTIINSFDITPKEEKMDLTTPDGRAFALGLPTPPDINPNDWALILVNTSHQIDESFVPTVADATSLTSTTPQDYRIVDSLNALAADCEANGLSVYLSSGYRSYAQQEANLQRKLNEGLTYEQAITMVQPAGSSEHQTGLCCDITDVYYPLKSPSKLEQTSTYKWLYLNCARYGFILRYPNGKSEITGIIYEPWHFRYVGIEAAEYIMNNNLTLEEFLGLYGIS